MKINLSSLKPLAWFYILVIILGGIMTYANITGWRVFSSTSQQSWEPADLVTINK